MRFWGAVRWSRSSCGLLARMAAAVVVGATPALAQSKSAARVDPPSQVNRVVKPDQVLSVQVPVNKSKVIEIGAGFKEATVGKSEIADVVPMNNRRLYVLGRSVGLTSISVVSDTGRLTAVIEVEVTQDVQAMSRALRQGVPEATVRPRAVNGRVLLEGAVPDGPAAKRAEAIAGEFAPNSVTNALSVSRSQQVMLEVRFVEVSRSAQRQLGVDWRVLGNRVNVGTGPFLNQSASTGSGNSGGIPVNLPNGDAPFGAALARVLSGGVTADVLIRALEDRGLARRLAEPDLVALSGETANFLAGGEFPFPVISNASGGVPQIGVEFKKYGVGLAFTPTVLSQGVINLRIEPEVSSIDPTNVIQIGNVAIPSLIVRRANTTVELRDGQSFAIAGLFQTVEQRSQNQLPWVGQVPVLGALFRSASFQRDETDLVIIITPHLVKPLAPTQVARTPMDNRAPGNDIDFFLNGQGEVPRHHGEPPRNATRVVDNRGLPANKYGHMIDVRQGDAVAQPPQ